MPETLQMNYLSGVDEVRLRVSRRKFYVHLSRRTSDAHLPWVSRFKGIGQIKVNSPEDSDYILLFCPIVSRVGTDISEALENIPAGDKEVILVVMHHTFNRDHVVSESRKQVSDPKVLLVVDTLFFEGRPLESNRNDIAWDEIKKFFGVRAEVSRCCSIEIIWDNIKTFFGVPVHAEFCGPMPDSMKNVLIVVLTFFLGMVVGRLIERDYHYC